MKLGITKEELPMMAERFLRQFGSVISGAGLGMFLAVIFIPEDDRKVFPFSFFLTAWVFICVGPIVSSSANLIRRKQRKDIVDEKHVA
jgi:hypothetical protein